MKYTYLLINLLTVILPVLLSFDKRIQFYKSWKYVWPGLLISAAFFLLWDVLFIRRGVWAFSLDYISGIAFFGLPLEELLFFITMPFACISIYVGFNHYVNWQMPLMVSQSISNALVVYCFLNCFNYSHHYYTLVTFGLLLFLVFIFQYFLHVQWLGRFYIAFLVSLLLFYMVNGFLTALPIVVYDDAQNLGIRIGTIPLENHFYFMAMLLMNIGLFEYFRTRGNKVIHE